MINVNSKLYLEPKLLSKGRKPTRVVELDRTNVVAKSAQRHWMLERNIGDTIRDIANNQLGTLTGGWSWVIGPPRGRALRFNGSTAHVDLGGTALLPSTADFSLSIGVTMRDLSLGWNALFAQYLNPGGNGRFILGAYALNKFTLFLGDQSVGSYGTELLQFDGVEDTYYNLTLTRGISGANSVFKIYLNGVLALTHSETSGRQLLQCGNHLGAYAAHATDYQANMSGFLDGDMNYCIYNDVELTADQVVRFHKDVYQTVKTKGVVLPFKAPAADTNVNTTLDALTLTEYTATITKDVGVTTSTDALTLTEYASTISNDTSISASLDTLTLTEYTSTITKDVNVTTAVDTLTLTEYAATITGGYDISANVDTLTLTEYTATITKDVGITTAVAALTLTEYTASITTGTNITTTVDALTLTEYTSSIAVDVGISTSVDALTLTEYAATIDAGLKAVLIDGAGNSVISSNYGDKTLYFNGSNYYTIT